jgi:hypothetical protein
MEKSNKYVQLDRMKLEREKEEESEGGEDEDENSAVMGKVDYRGVIDKMKK